MNLFDEFFDTRFWENFRDQADVAWTPRVDFIDTEDAFLIHMDLPGLTKSEVDVSFDNGLLQISGERLEKETENGPQYHRIERARGRFARAFRLGDRVQVDKIHASFKDGVLMVKVPKSEEVKPIRVNIS